MSVVKMENVLIQSEAIVVKDVILASITMNKPGDVWVSFIHNFLETSNFLRLFRHIAWLSGLMSVSFSVFWN